MDGKKKALHIIVCIWNFVKKDPLLIIWKLEKNKISLLQTMKSLIILNNSLRL